MNDFGRSHTNIHSHPRLNKEKAPMAFKTKANDIDRKSYFAKFIRL
jgi:hypothetical protein